MAPRIKKAVRYLSLRLRLHDIVLGEPVRVQNVLPGAKFVATVAGLHINETMDLLRGQNVAYEVRAA